MADEADFERGSDTAFFDEGEYCFKYDEISPNYINLIRSYLIKNVYIDAKVRFEGSPSRKRTSKLSNYSGNNRGGKMYRDKYLRLQNTDEETDNKIKKGYLLSL